MARGFSLAELAVWLALAGLLAGMALPRLAGVLDWIAVDQSAQQATTALAVGRHAAVQYAARTRIVIGPDSLRVDRWASAGWESVARWSGPAELGVALRVSNPAVLFGPTGIGYGVSNTKIVLQRGGRVVTITVSRLGRVKRW